MEVEEDFECETCHQTFSSRRNLRIHCESDRHIQKVEEEEGEDVENMDFRLKARKKTK